MKNQFDKKAFEKKQKKILLACLTVGLIGIISVICAFSVGAGIKFGTSFQDQVDKNKEIWDEYMDSITPDEDDDFGTDPCNYYGDYYYLNNFVITKLSVTKNGLTSTVFDVLKSENEQYSVKYASAEYCLTTFDKEAPALIVYQGSMQKYKLMWISEVDGKFVLTGEDKTYTQTPITLESLHNDPKDYYAKYYARDNTIISTIDINANTVTITNLDPITNESDVLTYQYTFICGEYSNIITEKEKAALLLHNGDISQGYYPIWIEKNESGLYTVSDRSKVQYTTEVISPDSYFNDPKDYYGDYYGNDEAYTVFKLSITNNKLVITSQNPMTNDTTEEFLYTYFSSEYMSRLFNEHSHALVAYKEKFEEPTHIFYLSKNENGVYEINSTQNVKYGTTPISFADLMEDPKNYYGFYQFSDDNKLELFENGTATLVLNGVTKTCDYFYANREWLKTRKIDFDPAIILVEKGNGNFYAFKIDSEGNMRFSNQYTFKKS